MNMTNNRFNYYSDYKGIALGFSIAKPNKCTGWGWYISLDLIFFSVWIYFNRLRR